MKDCKQPLYGESGSTPTAIPVSLRVGLEYLSGISMEGVRVYYNSPKPAEFQALAYAQGNEIHLGSGQEKHLPHEAWHVVQQRQGRVEPSSHVHGTIVNDDRCLEREADLCGPLAWQVGRRLLENSSSLGPTIEDPFAWAAASTELAGLPIQFKVVTQEGDTAELEDVNAYITDNDLMIDESIDLEDELEQENGFLNRNKSIHQFLIDIGFLASESDSDEEWDPASEAAEPLLPEDIVKSEIRAGLAFKKAAKDFMKLDTPKNTVTGNYVCHICHQDIVQGESVDMDHLPPWKDRLDAFITCNNLTEDDADELTGPLMAELYNMRGSVFAHSGCNRGHAGKGNYKTKWGNASNWYNAGGGSPF